jgi:hypothetical protein
VKLALFDDHRLGVVTGDGIIHVTEVLPWPYDPDPLSADWWPRLCHDFAEARSADRSRRKSYDSTRSWWRGASSGSSTACGTRARARCRSRGR